MSCPYCTDITFTNINTTTKYSDIEISLNKLGQIRVRTESTPEMLQELVNIKYCPMCGRKF